MGILLIDDSRTMRKILHKKLKALGYERFFQADNGEAGLSVLQENIDAIDTIFVDAHMPVMDGFEFLHALEKIGVSDQFNRIMISSHLPQLESAAATFKKAYTLIKPIDSELLASFMKTLPKQPPAADNMTFATKATPQIAINFYFYDYERQLQKALAYNKSAKNFVYHEFKPFLQNLHARFEQADPDYAGKRVQNLFDQFYEYEQFYSSLSLLDNAGIRQLSERLVLAPQLSYQKHKEQNSDQIALEEHERAMFNTFEALYNRTRIGYKKAFKTILENRLKALCKAIFAAANESSAIQADYKRQGFSLPLKPRTYVKELLAKSNPNSDNSEYKHLLVISSLLQQQKRKQVSIVNENFDELEKLKRLVLSYDSELVVQGLRSFKQLLLHQSALSPDLIVADFENETMADFADTIKDKYAQSDFLVLFRSKSKVAFEQALQSGLVFTASKNYLHAPAHLQPESLHAKLESLL
ncbi:MAG: response regulator [Campylobacterota bacterium]